LHTCHVLAVLVKNSRHNGQLIVVAVRSLPKTDAFHVQVGQYQFQFGYSSVALTANGSLYVGSHDGLVHLPPSQSKTSLQKQKSGPLLDRSCLPLKSREIKAIEIHHFVPGRRKVAHEDRLRVAAPIHFGQRS